MKEYRESDRIPLRAHAHLTGDTNSFPAHLLNVSRDGVLIAITEDHTLSPGQQVALCIEINDEEKLDFEGTVAHVKEHYIGLECRANEACSLSLSYLLDKLEKDNDLKVDY